MLFFQIYNKGHYRIDWGHTALRSLPLAQIGQTRQPASDRKDFPDEQSGTVCAILRPTAGFATRLTLTAVVGALSDLPGFAVLPPCLPAQPWELAPA